MRRTIVRWSVLLGLFLGCCSLGYAQNEAVHGQVTDAGGKPMTGVTVKAVNGATGEAEQAQTNSDGIYNLPLRTGSFTVTASQTGFGNATQAVEIVAGDNPEVNFKMLAGAQNAQVAVTSTGAQNAVTQQQVENLPSNGRNQIDLTLQAPRSDQNVIVNDVFVAYGNTGGNAQILMDGQQLTTIIAQGFGQPHFSKDAVEQLQMGDRFDATQGRSTKLIVQEVTKSGTNQYLGRASGYFRNDVLNSPDYININPATGNYKTLPYSDKQYSFTFGGPIIKDKLHFFGNYEYETNPQSYPYNTVWNGSTIDSAKGATPYVNAPSWNTTVTTGNTFQTYGGRVDWQLRGKDHLMVRAGRYTQKVPLDYSEYNGVNNEPAAATGINKYDYQVYGVYTKILNSKSVNTLRMGASNFWWEEASQAAIHNSFSAYSGWNGYPATQFAGQGTPALTFTASGAAGNAFTVGQQHTGSPEYLAQTNWTIRDDLSRTAAWHGGHTFKVGGEWIDMRAGEIFQGGSSGTIGLTVPESVIENLPNYFTSPGGAPGSGIFDVDTWNLAGLTQYTTSFSKAIFGPNPEYYMYRQYYAGYGQDDWQIKRNLTINLGLRYDIATNLFGEAEAVPGLFNSGRPIPKNAVGPRVGFTYKLTPTLIMRGGYGKYFGDVGMQTSGVAGAYEDAWQTAAFVAYTATSATTTGGTGFDGTTAPTLQSLIQQPPQLEGYQKTPSPVGTGNPIVPVAGSVLAAYCVNNNASGAFSINSPGTDHLGGNAKAPGCIRPNEATPGTLGGYGWSNNANIGIQKLYGRQWVINADFYYEGGRHQTAGGGAQNVFWNPDGTNQPYVTNLSGVSQNTAAQTAIRPFPNYGTVSFAQANTLSNYLGITTTITRRVGAFTGTLTHTWSEIRDATESLYGSPAGTVLPGAGVTNGVGLLPFKVATGYEGLNDYTFANTDQRNRLNFNFLYKLPHGVSLSGLYFFGSGQALAQTYSFGGNGIEDDGGTGSAGLMPTAPATANGKSVNSFVASQNFLPVEKGYTITNLQGERVTGGIANGQNDATLCAGTAAGNTTDNVNFVPACILARNGFHPDPIDRVDMRLTKTIKVGERVTADIFAETFNLLNHTNYGTWNTVVNKGANANGTPSSSASYGLPSYNFALPFQARMAQFGFKVDFKL